MSRRALVLVLLGTLIALIAVAPASAHNQGCTPGFWKTHTGAWVGLSPSQTVEDVFNVPNAFGLDNDTLLKALGYSGGPGLAGMARNLLRHAVAAALNALHPDVAYPLTFEQVRTRTNTALNSGSRSAMEAQKNQFGTFNRLICPL